ncbi:4-(cytidine 5'-diphospho)-2-C-methyl-D-erythritol kinase [Deltaproteobacteria bacterium OttesenSCG-928-M10]|nr:4-(cytidine 5'-diphospho)-2-C-methyl-D-erythritol kinase [Deltaproteobacteria bacterium OttesenSCG-928-M10]
MRGIGAARCTGSQVRAAIAAPAKLNLALRVLGRRLDGYHELDMVMARLELADRLELEFLPEPGDSLETVSAFRLPPGFDGPGNLILRAVRAYRERTGWPRAGVHIFLEKNIPLGGGLGGGSSDGAAILALLNRLCPTPLSEPELTEAAVKLGADVPFFLQPRPLARVRGIGELFSDPPDDFRRWAGRKVILVNPVFEVSTPAVFQSLGLTKGSSGNNLGPISEVTAGENDLLTPACEAVPVLKDVRAAIERLSPPAWGMSGSGATFWLAAGDSPAMAPALKNAHPQWWIVETAIAISESCS